MGIYQHDSSDIQSGGWAHVFSEEAKLPAASLRRAPQGSGTEAGVLCGEHDFAANEISSRGVFRDCSHLGDVSGWATVQED